jgi:methyl-accepting chemotaxis protein
MSFSTRVLRLLLVSIFFTFATHVLAQSASATSPTTPPITSSRVPPRGNGTSTTRPPSVSTDGPPDVLLQVPELHVGRIELVVEKLQADLNLNAKVAGLVQVNAGVQVAVEKVNITIADVDVNLELVVRLGNLVNIVERVFDSLDLNPLLISLIGNVTDLVGEVIGAVDGLVRKTDERKKWFPDNAQLGSITQNGKTLNFLVDNLGNIVQEVVGAGGDALSQIVGNFKVSSPTKKDVVSRELTHSQLNMTEVAGSVKQVGQGLTQTTYNYDALGSLVDIITNTAGQVVQAVVQKPKGGSGGGGGASSSSVRPSGSATPMPVTLSDRARATPAP